MMENQEPTSVDPENDLNHDKPEHRLDVPAKENHAAGRHDVENPPVGLQLDQVTISTPDKDLLERSSATIAAGKITLIVGPSGAGKSVLLRTFAGLLPKTGESLSWTGEIKLQEESLNRNSIDSKGFTRGRIGVVFQQFALFDEWSSQSNIQFAIDHASKSPTTSTENPSSKKALTQSHGPKYWMDQLGVPTNVAVGNLSGGQKQRLAIARTLASCPSIVLYDEPTSGLDAASGTRVADLIRTTHNTHGRTSIIVTHDYPTLLPIADEVILFNAETKKLESIARERWQEIPHKLNQLLPAKNNATTSQEKVVSRLVGKALEATGAAVMATVTLPLHLLPLFPRWKWGFRFVAHYLNLIAGPSAWVYLIIAGMIAGFTATFFTFRFLPFRLYTQPLLIDELLASVGFALYRILVPILATILIAARCGAAVTADVGVKRYGGQTDALKTMGLQPSRYLLTTILLAFLLATPFLEWLSFEASKLTSLFTFLHTHPEIGAHFWDQHFHQRLSETLSAENVSTLSLQKGWIWVLGKNLLCGIGTAAIAFYRGMRPKQSASDVSSSVTSTVLWATLYVLAVHFVVALFEF